MPKISRELALEFVHLTPYGKNLLGAYEALAEERVLQPRVDFSEKGTVVSYMSDLRGDTAKNVIFFTNGVFSNVRVNDLRSEEEIKPGVEVGLEPGVVFSIETGTFNREMQRIDGVDFNNAPFNARVRQLGAQYNGDQASEVAYRIALTHLEQALETTGSVNKIKFIE